MKDRIKDLLAFTFGLLLIVVAMYLFIAWEFRATDAVASIIYVMGVGIGVWATRICMASADDNMSPRVDIARAATVWNAMGMRMATVWAERAARFEVQVTGGAYDDARRERCPPRILVQERISICTL